MTGKGYSKAPITEALIDLRVELPPEFALITLEGIHRGIEAEYPFAEDMFTIQSQVQTGAAVTAMMTQTPVGYRFINSEKNQVFQARLDGFTFSRLAPYETWEAVRDEAKRLWQLYKDSASPKQVVQVAVRYINRLDLPLPLNDFKDYLRTAPEVSPDLPQSLSDFFMQLVVEQSDLKGWLTLREAVIPPPIDTENVVSVVLDIDLACKVNFTADEDECWNLLEKLRVRKNEVFKACITDETERLFR